MPKQTILERLNNGDVLIGDGGFVFALEKRGYVKAGPWTPEAAVENPEAVRQLHREFLRAGSDIMQAFTFYASDDKLENRGNDACAKFGGSEINRAACKLAREVANEGEAYVIGGISQTPTYLSGIGKEKTMDIFRRQIKVFKEEKLDMVFCEYFEHVEEAEWATEAAKEFDMPVAVTMCIGPLGDMHGVSTGEVAVRLAKAGAQVVGINCHFDPFVTLDAMQLMIDACKAANVKVHFICQPLGYLTPDAGRQGFIDLPEFPFALEPRICTRFQFSQYARRAYDMGIRIIGGCCGVEPYHMRSVAEELAPERGGKLPAGSQKHIPWAGGLAMHTKPWVRARARRDYWEKLCPSTGRPYSASMSKPDNWGMTAGSELLKQHQEATTESELSEVFEHSAKVKH